MKDTSGLVNVWNFEWLCKEDFVASSYRGFSLSDGPTPSVDGS